jgi:hypothetical protein
VSDNFPQDTGSDFFCHSQLVGFSKRHDQKVPMSLNSHLQELIGRRIVGVVAMESERNPRARINLVLDDGSYLEIYGNDLHNAKGCWPGGMEAARKTEGVFRVVREFGEG